MFRYLNGLFVLLTSFVSYAVEFTYRVDLRPPGVIFSSGFSSLGLNDNLYFHAEGLTCYGGSRDTAFISTSASRDFSVDWGQLNPVGTTYYVYRIRATNNFYNTYDSLMNSYNQTGNEVIYNSASVIQYQQEFSALYHIPPSQIVEAEEFISSRGESIFVSSIPNPNYESQDTTSNPGFYPVPNLNADAAAGNSCSRCVGSHLSRKTRSLSEYRKMISHCEIITGISIFF